MARKACHVFASTTRFGLTQALGMSMKLILAVALLVLTPVAQAARVSCDALADHAGQRACLEKQAAASGSVVVAEHALSKRISAWDEDRAYRIKSLELLAMTARQFRIYRNAQCNFDASSTAGGNGAGDLRFKCQIALDDAYLKMLQERAVWFSSPHA
jgi:hypothetical protein